MYILLLLSVFVIATCGLVYELVAGTLASYLLGDSVTQFSTIIGVYLFSMGIGSYLSKYIQRNTLGWFVQIEILVGLVGGISSVLLFMLFEHVSSFRVILYALISITGTLVGMEIPLLLRILKDKVEFSELVSKVFTFDYIGALLASVAFPLLLVPYLGLIRTSMMFGILNVLVAYFVCLKFEKEMKLAGFLKITSLVVTGLLLAGFVLADKLTTIAEGMAYAEPVIYSKSSPYQRIILTKNKRDLRLYLNGNLQFSSADEYRYHESLIHPGIALVDSPVNILVLGGGDGMAVREILKYPSVKTITLIDLDRDMTSLFSSNKMLTGLNNNALLSKKVTVVNTDAFQWLKQSTHKFDFVVIDFPDPSNYSLGKLYTTAFYNVLKQRLNSDAVAVIQSTSPLAAPKSYWCIVHTLESCGFKTLPYHAYVPSFGEWGYVLASLNDTIQQDDNYPASLKFISPPVVDQMFNFPADMAERKTDINKLNNQALVNYFEEEWSAYAQ
ncbi:MAG TPA: polyamine aminopropyltransferase [Chitinophagales bacterium]|nr:polyamine aminopropyltransferase [Chitinophagales bacterium]